MPFRFPLAAVLKFRESLEHREYLELEKIQQEIMGIESQIREIEELHLAASQRREADLAVGLASVYLQDEFDQEFALEQRRDILKAKLDEAKLRRTEHLKIYQEARQKREVLDELRKRGLDAYEQKQTKRQQALMDDLFLSRRKHKR